MEKTGAERAGIRHEDVSGFYWMTAKALCFPLQKP